MRPRFGALTKITSVVYIITGLAAGRAGLGAGNQATPGHQYDRLILFSIAIGFAVVGLALFVDSLWAWWTSVAIAVFTVGVGRAVRLEAGDLIPWAVVLCLLVTSAVQGIRDNRNPQPPYPRDRMTSPRA